MARWISQPSSGIVSPVTTGELADFARLESDDPVIPGILIAATSAVIEFLKFELLNRERITTYQTWPILGTPAGGLSWPMDRTAALSRVVNLPYAKLDGDPTFVCYGSAFTDFEVRETLPASVLVNSFPAYDEDFPAIVATYTAGLSDDSAGIPEEIKTALLMVASFMYAHRGACDGQEAIQKSGAAGILQPFRAEAVVF